MIYTSSTFKRKFCSLSPEKSKINDEVEFEFRHYKRNSYTNFQGVSNTYPKMLNSSQTNMFHYE